jgi:hypothetical protein
MLQPTNRQILTTQQNAAARAAQCAVGEQMLRILDRDRPLAAPPQRPVSRPVQTAAALQSEPVYAQPMAIAQPPACGKHGEI